MLIVEAGLNMCHLTYFSETMLHRGGRVQFAGPKSFNIYSRTFNSRVFGDIGKCTFRIMVDKKLSYKYVKLRFH